MVNIKIHNMGKLVRIAGFPSNRRIQKCSAIAILHSHTKATIEELRAAIARANEALAKNGWEFRVGAKTFGRLVRIKVFPKNTQFSISGAQTVLNRYLDTPIGSLKDAIAEANEDLVLVGWKFRQNPDL